VFTNAASRGIPFGTVARATGTALLRSLYRVVPVHRNNQPQFATAKSMTDNNNIYSDLKLLFYVILPVMGGIFTITVLSLIWFRLSRTAADARALKLIFMMDSSAADLDEELLLGGDYANDYPKVLAKKRAEAPKARPESQADIADDDLVQQLIGKDSANEVMPLSHGRAPARFKSKTRIQRIAIALAGECYFKFGRRPKSEANVLISRKWMRDRMEEVKDFRKKDAASVIDIALALSFYPSVEAREMDQHLSTAVSASRMAEVSDSLWCRFKAWLGLSGSVDWAGLEPTP